ncbi:MAG: tetratricopeptide repeat protein [candidate division KSB1 bacterium]|nr:tetratricopeptide repeat protein [candidate division KSB1 bacterium]
MLKKLQKAARKAGWSEGDIALLSRLYERQGMFSHVNWRLVVIISGTLFLMILPFIWWANQPETKMKLLFSLTPDEVLLQETPPTRGELVEPFRRFEAGEFDRVILDIEDRLARLPESDLFQAENLLGLAYLFEKQPEKAVIHLQKALALVVPEDEGRLLWYLANAYLRLGDRQRAENHLQQVVKKGGPFKSQALYVLQRMEILFD